MWIFFKGNHINNLGLIRLDGVFIRLDPEGKPRYPGSIWCIAGIRILFKIPYENHLVVKGQESVPSLLLCSGSSIAGVASGESSWVMSFAVSSSLGLPSRVSSV